MSGISAFWSTEEVLRHLSVPDESLLVEIKNNIPNREEGVGAVEKWENAEVEAEQRKKRFGLRRGEEQLRVLLDYAEKNWSPSISDLKQEPDVFWTWVKATVERKLLYDPILQKKAT